MEYGFENAVHRRNRINLTCNRVAGAKMGDEIKKYMRRLQRRAANILKHHGTADEWGKI
jgi:hypothetical protein